MFWAALAVAPLLAGSLVYCVLTVIAARRYLSTRAASEFSPQPISVLKSPEARRRHPDAVVRARAGYYTAR